MKKKIAIIVLLGIVIDIITMSCGSKPVTCLVNFTKVDTRTNSNYYDSTSHQYVNNTLVSQYDSVQFNTAIFGEAYNCVNVEIKSCFFINSAIAFTKAKPSFKLQDTISSINVYTVNNYNSSFVAGANVNSIFINKIDFYSNWSVYHFSTTDIIPELKKEMISQDTYSSGVNFTSKFTQKPSNSGDTVQLVFAIGLTNGKTIKDTTEKIVLLF